MIRVLCVDDHAIVREGIARVISRQRDMRVIAAVATGEEGVAAFDRERPDLVRYVSGAPALAPVAAYEIQRESIPQVDMANFRTGVRVVFPEGFVERGNDFIVYYGAADVSVAGARVGKRELIASLGAAMDQGTGGEPL